MLNISDRTFMRITILVTVGAGVLFSFVMPFRVEIASQTLQVMGIVTLIFLCVSLAVAHDFMPSSVSFLKFSPLCLNVFAFSYLAGCSNPENKDAALLVAVISMCVELQKNQKSNEN